MKHHPAPPARPVARAVQTLCAALAAAAPPAQATHGAADTTLPTTIVVQGNYDNAVGSHDAASAGTVRREAVLARALQRPGDVLEFVPGVVVTQHSGEGKANQYFLRGFNLDHGTDFATRVDGLPVNMPSHGHGQGYSDLNFLIPELVQRIDYRKGPYTAAVGDFAAAGSADIRLVTTLPAPLGLVTLGRDGHRRAVAAASRPLAEGVSLLAGLELAAGDGPWTVPQRQRKASGVLTLAGGTRTRGWQLSLQGYGQRWTATDQVPERLLQPGTGFGRFDSLDATSGGDSARHSLAGEWHEHGERGKRSASAWLIHSDLDLNSNFTYALERPDDGDQFKQRDRRLSAGGELAGSVDHALGGLPATTTLGLQLRHDRIRNGLYDSVARAVTATVREDRIEQTNTALHLATALELSPAVRAVLGLRADHLSARVDALTLPANGGRASATQWSPKATLVWAVTPRTELSFNAGRGLHSNDARGMTTRTDPRSGEPLAPVPTWVPVDAAEIGLRTEAVPGLQSSVVLWGLRSASELVYVGDAGGNEPSLASRRRGIEINQRWTPARGVVVDADLAFNHARLSDGSRIPNAVDRVAALALTLRDVAGLDASLQWRYLGSAALTEDNTLRSRPASTVNLRLARRLAPRVTLALDVSNLFDRAVDDIQYAYESQLPGEAEPVLDRHLHPAEPRRVRLTLRTGF